MIDRLRAMEARIESLERQNAELRGRVANLPVRWATGDQEADRWGKLLAPLAAQTTTGVAVDEYELIESGSGQSGTWQRNGEAFLTIDRCLPSGVTIPAGKWVGCSRVSPKLWCVEVVECAS